MFSSIMAGMATKKVLIFFLFLFRASWAANDEEAFERQRHYLQKRYEDFYQHYEQAYRYDKLKERSAKERSAEDRQADHQKEQARKDYLKIRRLPGPYNVIDDDKESKEVAQLKDKERKVYLERRATLEKIRKLGPEIPENIESGVVDPLQEP